MPYIIPHSTLRLYSTHFNKHSRSPFYSYRKLSLKYPYSTISKSSMLDCMYEQTFVTAGRNGYTLQSRSRVFKLLHRSVSFAVRQTGRLSDSWRWKRALAAPAALRGAGQIRTVGNGVKQGRGRSEEMRIEGEDGSRRLNCGPPVGVRPTAPLVPTRRPFAHLQKRIPHHPLFPRGHRIMLSTLWLYLGIGEPSVRERWVLSKPINMKVFFLSQPLLHPLEGESRGEKSVWLGLRAEKKKKGYRWNRDITVNGQPVGRRTHDWELEKTRLMDPEGHTVLWVLDRNRETGTLLLSPEVIF